MSDFLAELPDRYRVILCDLWGCVHNGVAILPGVEERLDRWRAEERKVIFLTNAPRPADAVVAQLAGLGLPERLNGSIVSSGDTALAWLKAGTPRSATFIGSRADADRLTKAGLQFVPETEADTIVCSGFDERGFQIGDYAAQLHRLANRGLEMLCLNPDRVVHRGRQVEPCAGAIADAFAEAGGRVRMFGKPYPDIYDQAIRQAGHDGETPCRDQIVAIGDSIATDFVGAANSGIDFIFVAGGIDEAGYRTDAERVFDTAPGLQARPTRPIAVVPGLG